MVISYELWPGNGDSPIPIAPGAHVGQVHLENGY